MSRRDKQADLRRRMAEARAKLVSSSHANASDLDNEIATDVSIKKRPLPSTGGILKKSKYSSSTPAIPPPSQTTDTPKAEDKSIDNDNALGSLMAGYGDSSDEDTNTKAASTSNTDDQSKQSSEPIQPTTNNDMQQQIPKKKKKKKKKKDKPPFEDTNGVDNKIEAAQLKSEEAGNDKPTEVSDEVWDEFNALLDDDNDEIVAKDSPPLKSEETNNSIPVEGETSTKAETTTKKKKKKKGSKKKKDIYDNDDINTVEQASYEARLARLMLLKSKKTQHNNSTKTDEDNEKLLSASTNEFYNGGLAFQQDEEDDDNVESVKATATSNLKSDGVEEAKDADNTNTITISNTAASSISAPSVSLAAILRGRRDQARQVSRGNDKIDTAIDNEEEDESWF